MGPYDECHKSDAAIRSESAAVAPSLENSEVEIHADLQMKPWTGDRTNTKNWELYLRLNSLSGIKTEKGERQAFLSQFSPNKQCAYEKWEHKQAGEPRMYSPNTENVPLKSETIFSERQSWLDSESASSTGNRAQMVVEGFSLSVFYHINFCAVFFYLL